MSYTAIMVDFTGVKIALLRKDKLLVIQRDDKPGLRFAGLWDFPGGARDNDESPETCVMREIEEELGIKLDPKAIIWQKQHPAMHDPTLTAYFMVARITDENIKAIKFGDEGRGWKLISIDDFMAANDVVEPLKGRLQDYLAAKGR